MIQDLKTILIVVSATLAALFVHHALDQAQAVVAGIGQGAILQEVQLSAFVF